MPSADVVDVVLDTHVWVWWVSDPNRLSKAATSAMAAASMLGLCPISWWEVATKVSLGKLQLDREVGTWVRQAVGAPKVRVVPLTPEIATTAGLARQIPVITKDRRLRSFRRLTTIW